MDYFKTELDNNKDLSIEKQEGYRRVNFTHTNWETLVGYNLMVSRH